MTWIKKVLIAYDFSAYSERAACVAADLCRRYAASASVLYVWQSELLALYNDLPRHALGRDQSYPGRFVPQLEGICRELQGWGVSKVDMALMEGAPASTITRFAEQEGFDLIVVGTHDRTSLSRAWLGSVAEEVVRTAPCAVITVPSARTRAPADPSDT